MQIKVPNTVPVTQLSIPVPTEAYTKAISDYRRRFGVKPTKDQLATHLAALIAIAAAQLP